MVEVLQRHSPKGCCVVLSERFVAWVLHNSPKLDPGLFRTPPEATQNPTSLENAGSGIWQTGFGSFVEEQSVAIDLGHTRARSRRTRPSHQPARGSVRLPKWLGFDGAAFAMKARAWLCPVCGHPAQNPGGNCSRRVSQR